MASSFKVTLFQGSMTTQISHTRRWAGVKVRATYRTRGGGLGTEVVNKHNGGAQKVRMEADLTNTCAPVLALQLYGSGSNQYRRSLHVPTGAVYTNSSTLTRLTAPRTCVCVCVYVGLCSCTIPTGHCAPVLALQLDPHRNCNPNPDPRCPRGPSVSSTYHKGSN